MGQSSDEPFHAEIAANSFSRREIEACVSRVGVHDRRQFGHLGKCRRWSSRRKLGVIEPSSFRARSSPLARERDLAKEIACQTPLVLLLLSARLRSGDGIGPWAAVS